jgi:alpha-ketoglutarate-dependent taurine dioxygenase
MPGISGLSKDALIAFAAQFGEPLAPPFDPTNELVSAFSDTYGSFGSNVELPFHSDLQYLEAPPSATIPLVRRHEVTGRQALFVSAYTANRRPNLNKSGSAAPKAPVLARGS